MQRRCVVLCTFVGLAPRGVASREAEPIDVGPGQDVDELWRTLAERCGYFGAKTTDWNLVRRGWRPRAESATSVEACREVIRRTVAELDDAHSNVWDLPQGSPRPPRFDMRAEPDDHGATIVELRAGGPADAAGLRPGDRVLAIDSTPTAQAAAQHRPQCLSRDDPVSPAASEPSVSWRPLEDGYGYIRIASFADPGAIAAFDQALEALREAPGLMLDVRRNGGGDTAVSRPMLARLVDRTAVFADMRRREGHALGQRWAERVEPRGPFTYRGAVVVLTDFWSASLAEGFAMAIRGLGRGLILGRLAMRLGAGVWPFRLDRSGIQGQYSAEPVYDVDDRPRDLLVPDVVTAPDADAFAPGLVTLRRARAHGGLSGWRGA